MSNLWRGQFGKKYTDRNPTCAGAVDTHYRKTFGVTRTALNEQFLQNVPLDARILEVGCNVGAQLDVLREMGYVNLYGIEPMEYAVHKAAHPNITQGYAGAMQFSDGAFDLVYTSGVLIHIPPAEMERAMREIVRVSRRWVWGWEYYCDEYQAIEYRGEQE
jgi:pseudaminic acid biosynthesis-associated methylase